MRRLNLALFDSFNNAFLDFEFQVSRCSIRRKHRHVALEVVSPTQVCFLRLSRLWSRVRDFFKSTSDGDYGRLFKEVFVKRCVLPSSRMRGGTSGCPRSGRRVI